MDKLEIGQTGTYIHDLAGVEFVCDMPPEVALAWVQQKAEDAKIDSRCNLTAKDLQVGGEDRDRDILYNGWLNKLYVCVEHSFGYSLCIYAHDLTFSLYKVMD